MKAHYSREHERRTYYCQQCDKQFSSPYTRNNHVSAVHDKEKKWPCETCKKNFSFQPALYKHFKSKFHKNNEEKGKK